MSDEPKTLDVRIAELESAVKKLTESATGVQGMASPTICTSGPVCAICHVCAVCHVCSVCHVCTTCICRVCRPICNECTCGPCAQ